MDTTVERLPQEGAVWIEGMLRRAVWRGRWNWQLTGGDTFQPWPREKLGDPFDGLDIVDLQTGDQVANLEHAAEIFEARDLAVHHEWLDLTRQRVTLLVVSGGGPTFH